MRFLHTLERLMRESPDPLAPWRRIHEIQMDVRQLPTLWFSEVTDEEVARLIYFDVVRLSTDHRAFLDDTRAVNFLHSLVHLAVGSPQIGNAFRFQYIFERCVHRWSFDQCAICCWILSQHQSLSSTGEDMVHFIRFLNIERELLEACGRLFPFLPWVLIGSFKSWLTVYLDVRLAEGTFGWV